MKKIFIINDDTMGGGSRELGKKLINSFLLKLWASKLKPDALVFYNAGVKLLTSQGGNLIPLNGLRDAGVDLLACGTCLDYFKIADDVAVGRVSNMEEILDLIQKAEKVVTI